MENLEYGDTVKVYRDLQKTRILGTSVVGAGSTGASLNVTTLDPLGGYIYISVTNSGKSESNVATKQYEAVTKSVAPLANEITITNNGFSADIVNVENLEPGDIIKVYRDLISTKVLGTATVATGQTSKIVNIAQLGQASG